MDENFKNLFQQNINYSRRNERSGFLRRGEHLLQPPLPSNNQRDLINSESLNENSRNTDNIINNNEININQGEISNITNFSDIIRSREINTFEIPRRTRAGMIQRESKIQPSNKRANRLELIKRGRIQSSQSSTQITQPSQLFSQGLLNRSEVNRDSDERFEFSAPKIRIQRRDQSIQREVINGRLSRVNNDIAVGKRSNVIVDISKVKYNSNGIVEPSEYFNLVYNSKPIRNNFLLDSDSASSTSDEWSSAAGSESEISSSDMSSIISSMRDDDSSSIVSNNESIIRSQISREQEKISYFRNLHPVPIDAHRSIHEQLLDDSLASLHEQESKHTPFRVVQSPSISQIDFTPINEHNLFVRTTDLSVDGDKSSPEPPKDYKNIRYLPSTPEEDVSIKSIPAQIPYSPNLDQLDTSKDITRELVSIESESEKHGKRTNLEESIDFSSDLSSDLPKKRKRTEDTENTKSLLRTPSDDEDTPSTPKSKKRTWDQQAPQMDVSDIDSSSPRRLEDETRVFERNDDIDIVGGVVSRLKETPANLKRRRVDDEDDKTSSTEESAMDISPHHVYKKIEYNPNYQELNDSDDDEDAEYIERYNDDSDDETYRDPNPFPHSELYSRRSERTRLPPLRRWMNEQADAETKEVIAPKTPPAAKKKKKRFQLDTIVDEREGLFYVNEDGRKKEKFVAATKKMIIQNMNHFTYESNNIESFEVTGHGNMSLTTVFSKDSLKAGCMIIHPNAVKPQGNSGSFRHIYTVVTGFIEVSLYPDGDQMSSETFKTYSGSMFYIPPNNYYVMRNTSNSQQCTLTYVMTSA